MENQMNNISNSDSDQSNLIMAHFNPEELEFMDYLQGGPSWIDIGNGQSVREYSALAELPNNPELRSIFEQAAMGEEEPEIPGMAKGGTPRGIPEDIDTIKSHGRHGDSEVALIPMNVADFFNELIGHSPKNKDHMPEYFSLSGPLKSVGNFVGNTLATAAPYVGQGVGSFIGGALGGGTGEQIGGAIGRGLGRFGQGLWNQEGVGQSALQGAGHGAGAYLQPQLQKSLGINPQTINLNGTPREQTMQGMVQDATSVLPTVMGALGGPTGAGIGETLGNTARGMMNGMDAREALMNGLKSGALEAGMPVGLNAIGAGFNSMRGQNSPLQTSQISVTPHMAHGGFMNIHPQTGLPEYGFLRNIFRAIAPILGGAAGFMLGGPMGAALGAGLGGTGGALAEGKSLGSALGRGALSGGAAYVLPNLLSSAGNMFGSVGSQAAGNAAVSSLPASAAGKLASHAGTQAVGNHMIQQPAQGGMLGSLTGGMGSLLSNPALPLAAMTGMSYMGHRDEQKRLKEWERKEDARREKYENAHGTFKPYVMPSMKPRTSRPFAYQEGYGERGGEHQFFDEPALFEAKGGIIPGIEKGQQDNVKAMLSPKEYVFDADSVQALGDGNSEAGAMILDRVRQNLRLHKRASKKGIPPKAKPFEKYMPVKAQKKFAQIGR